MKKTARIIVSLVLVLAFALCVFTACNKDKSEVKNMDANEVKAMFIGDSNTESFINALGKINNIKIEYKVNEKGVETTGFSILTPDNGSEYGATDGSIMHMKSITNGVETEQYVGYNVKIINGNPKKSGDLFELVQVTENGVSEKKVNAIETAAYNLFCKNNLVYYVSSLGIRIFNKTGDIIDTVEYSGTRTYNDGKLENTTICATYVDEENSINGKITLALSADEKHIAKATVEENNVVVYEATYTYGVDTIVMPLINSKGGDWEERTSYEVA